MDTFPAAANDGHVSRLGFDRTLQTFAVNIKASVELPLSWKFIQFSRSDQSKRKKDIAMSDQPSRIAVPAESDRTNEGGRERLRSALSRAYYLYSISINTEIRASKNG